LPFFTGATAKIDKILHNSVVREGKTGGLKNKFFECSEGTAKFYKNKKFSDVKQLFPLRSAKIQEME